MSEMNIKVRKCVTSVLGALIIFPFLQGCGTAQDKKLEKEGFTLIFRPKSAAGPLVGKMQLNHPVNISQSNVKNHLMSLGYEELSLMGKKKYINSPKNLEEVSRLLTKALNRVNPNNIIRYEVETPKGTTAGDLFATQDKLNWRFDKIKGVNFSGSSFPGFRGSTWRLIPVPGQKYFVKKQFFGNSTKENWIVADLILPKQNIRKIRQDSRSQATKKRSRTQRSVEPDESPSSVEPATSPELEKKLRFLKDLRQKNLIDEEEYQRKRSEILDEYL